MRTRCQRGWALKSPGSAGAAFDAEQTCAEADCEGLDAHAAGLGHGEVAELVNQHHEAEDDQELDDDLKKVHAGGGDLVRVIVLLNASAQFIHSAGELACSVMKVA